MDILRVLRERSTNANVSTKAPAATQLIDQSGCSTQKPEESYEKTTVEAGADLFPRVVRLSCMLPDSSNERDVVITVLENPSGSWTAGNGSTLWDSSIALSGYLLKHQMSWLQGKCGLELGAGTHPMLQCSSFSPLYHGLYPFSYPFCFFFLDRLDLLDCLSDRIGIGIHGSECCYC